jgi:putative redox protein
LTMETNRKPSRIVIRKYGESHQLPCSGSNPGSMIHLIDKRIELIGSLDEVQRVRLLEIADRCPVHRTLTSRIEIRSALVSASE